MEENLVLICDDDENIADTLGLIVESAGVHVFVEYHSENIFTRLKEHQATMLIIDLWMPVMSGDEVIRQLRAEPVFKDLYIICISASIDGRKVALDAGADVFVAKPFDMDDIIATVEQGFAKIAIR